MIEVTKLDGQKLYLNERNIQWIEDLPNPAVVFLGGARVIVLENIEDLKKKIDDVRRQEEAGSTSVP